MLLAIERDEDDEPQADANPPEEWVNSVAAAEGISPEEVVERLVSSYWTLTEVYEMLSGTEGDIGLAAASGIDPKTADTTENDKDVSTDEDNEDDPTSEDGMDTSAVEENKNTSTVENDEDTPMAEEGRDAPTVENSEDVPTVEDVKELEERLNSLEEELQAQQDSQASIETDLGRLTQRIDGLEGELRNRQTSIESRLDEELENLETILTHLIDSTEAMDEDLSSILREWPAVQDSQAERERLIDLKQTASQLGVRSGECEHCGSSVDIGILPTADCPDCGKEFVDIEPATGWHGMGANTLVTAEEAAIELNNTEDGPQDPGDEKGGLLDR